MADEVPDVPALRAFDAPPGGLALLRERLDAEGRRPRRWWLAAVPAVIALAVMIVLVLRPVGRRLEDEPVRATTALSDPTVGGRDVAFYWVASSPHGARARSPQPPQTISIADAPRVTAFPSP
ncbi:MAG: hypothetical protein ABI175_18610 [Polyangiales bacterium]